MTSHTAKACRRGTHRTIQPAETLARLRPILPRMGITRLANVTGLDTVGIPVVMAVRPNSRSIAVSQGKGLTLDAAMASAAMESVEGYHAEMIEQPLKLASYDELCVRHTVADPLRLPLSHHHRFRPGVVMLWIEGEDLQRREKVWVPYQLVHTAYTVRMQWDMNGFAATSTGLASGNHRLEAVSHALCEVIERDCSAKFRALSDADRDALRLDLNSVSDPDVRWLLDRFEAGGIDAAVWDTTTQTGVAAFECLIAERQDHPQRLLVSCGGSGCHSVPEIALIRAITEAAQSRLTIIAGARDDMTRREYDRWKDPSTVEHWRREASGQGSRPFSTVPRFESDSFEADVDWLLQRVTQSGCGRVVFVDLTQPEFEIPVVRVLVEGMHDESWREGKGRSPEALA